jgi:hypothetical protein
VPAGLSLVLVGFANVTIVRAAENGSVLHDCRIHRAGLQEQAACL